MSPRPGNTNCSRQARTLILLPNIPIGWEAIAGGSGTCAASRRVRASTKGDDFGAQLGLARGAPAGPAKLECFEKLDIKPCRSETQFRERGLCVDAKPEEFCR